MSLLGVRSSVIAHIGMVAQHFLISGSSDTAEMQPFAVRPHDSHVSLNCVILEHERHHKLKL